MQRCAGRFSLSEPECGQVVRFCPFPPCLARAQPVYVLKNYLIHENRAKRKRHFLSAISSSIL